MTKAKNITPNAKIPAKYFCILVNLNSRVAFRGTYSPYLSCLFQLNNACHYHATGGTQRNQVHGDTTSQKFTPGVSLSDIDRRKILFPKNAEKKLPKPTQKTPKIKPPAKSFNALPFNNSLMFIKLPPFSRFWSLVTGLSLLMSSV